MKHSVVALIFENGQKKVLCVKRRDTPIWVIPGGAVDPGESPEQAVVREVKEETGLDVVITRKVAEYTPIQIVSTITHAFECRPVKGTPCVTEEVSDIGYYWPDELPELFFSVHSGWIHEALENPSGIIRRDLTEVTWKHLFLYILRHPIYFIRFFVAKAFGWQFSMKK